MQETSTVPTGTVASPETFEQRYHESAKLSHVQNDTNAATLLYDFNVLKVQKNSSVLGPSPSALYGNKGGGQRRLMHGDELIPSGLTHALFFRLATSIASGVRFLHSRGVVHHDLKPSNILLKDSADPSAILPKLCDFGLARTLKQDEDIQCSSSQSAGTPSFMAPELIRGARATRTRQSMDGELRERITKIDVFSYGIVLWTLWTGRYRFPISFISLCLFSSAVS
jgi:serine/threonine protein kinase